MTNEPYTLTIEAPLLRAGMRLTVGPMSKKYAAQAILDALDIVREVNPQPTTELPVESGYFSKAVDHEDH